ncbi:MAG: alkaline phosphatase family protein [Acidobacteriota bacterium]|nr:alkaline phosphatase family protein [Acidobacteriota bacterium]
MHRFRCLRGVFLVVLFASVLLAAPPSGAAPEVMVLGFDGADPGLVQRYMDEGLLPHLQALAREGHFAPLMPTNPPQTPVSWAAFSTGLNPGRTEIFDFLYKKKNSYVPDFALATAGKKVFLFGERNGQVVAAAAGVSLALLVLLLLKLLGLRWLTAFGVALVAGGAAAVLVVGPATAWLPVEVPTATNNRQGTPFWTLAAAAGKKVGVVRVPVTFPAEALPAGSTMLSGLGVPDMRRRVGSPTLFTSDLSFRNRQNQFSLEFKELPARRGVMETSLIGPFNYPFHVFVLERAREQWKAQGLSAAERKEKEKALVAQLLEDGQPREFNLPLHLEVDDRSLRWEISGQKGELHVGEWSDWVILDFPVNWVIDRLQPLRGMGRFKLVALEPELQLYFSPVNFHPSCHPVNYSWPPDWAEKMSRKIGLFKTQGWAIDTWSPPSGVGGIDLFVEDMNFTVDAYERMMDAALAEGDIDVYVQIFYFTDRAGHMFWQQLDPQHPLYDPELADKYEQEMRKVYQRMDRLVGKARRAAGEDTLFLVLSDHGFSSFRRQININTWLYQHGYLALSGQVGTRNLEQLFDKHVTQVNVLSGIDWSRTRAWAMGLGSIYINVVGREPQGIVMPGEEYDRLVAELKEGLEGAVDEATGLKPVARIYTRDEMYEGYDPDKIADLRMANILGYRVSWQDALGGLSTRVFEDNERVWSGDHCSLDPAEVRGILFVNRQLKVEDPAIMDIAPSILATLGLEPDARLDGRVIW